MSVLGLKFKVCVLPLAAAALFTAASCRHSGPRIVPDAETLGFPVVEDGSVHFDGEINPPARARGAMIYFSTKDGSVRAFDSTARRILWVFQADNPVFTSPELGGGLIWIRDAGNVLYALDPAGKCPFKLGLGESVATPVREHLGRIFFATDSGRIIAIQAQPGGGLVWEFQAGSPVKAGPIFVDRLVIFGGDDGRVYALGADGKPVWTFTAKGAVSNDPVAAAGGVFFGTEDRYFYGLSAATGRRKWMFRLGGAPLHPPVTDGHKVFLAASNSVVYCLSCRGGDILWWQNVPSRILHEPCLAGAIVLVTSLTPGLAAFDLKTGVRTGGFEAASDLLTGAVWVSSRLLVVASDPASGGSRWLFLKRDDRALTKTAEKNRSRR